MCQINTSSECEPRDLKRKKKRWFILGEKGGRESNQSYSHSLVLPQTDYWPLKGLLSKSWLLKWGPQGEIRR